MLKKLMIVSLALISTISVGARRIGMAFAPFES